MLQSDALASQLTNVILALLDLSSAQQESVMAAAIHSEIPNLKRRLANGLQVEIAGQ